MSGFTDGGSASSREGLRELTDDSDGLSLMGGVGGRASIAPPAANLAGGNEDASKEGNTLTSFLMAWRLPDGFVPLSTCGEGGSSGIPSKTSSSRSCLLYTSPSPRDS